MKTFVIYDIVSDKIRQKIADICLNYGLERVQYSAFYGDLTVNRRQELALKLADRLGKNRGRIHIIPLCEKDSLMVRVLGKLLEAE